jgi:hypothetical protein
MLESVIVSYDDTNGKDSTILLVGRQRMNQTVEVINAFQGKEAEELYKKLTTFKPKGEKI